VPEAPEVETTRRVLDQFLVGERIASLEVRGSRLVRRHGPGELAGLEGRFIERVGRLGKFLVLETEGEGRLVVHLGMAGRLCVAEDVDGLAHVQLVLRLAHMAVVLIDPRTFSEAFVDVPGEGGRPARLVRLGPDVLDEPDAVADRLRLAVSRRPVKASLLDQQVVAGLGNMYADEALHRAGVHPRSPLGGLGPRREVLARTAHEVAREALAFGGTTFRDRAYRDPLGRDGRFGPLLRVYQRAGEPCLECGAPIARTVIQGRSCHWCPRCQAGGIG
jgi:formamidopyrimidine-DNA glycosylase